MRFLMKASPAAMAAMLVTTLAAVGLASPAQAAVPSAPASCSVAEESGDFRISWTAPSNAGGKPVRDYRIREKGFARPLVIVANPARRSYVWTDAARARPATFTIRARNADGVGRVCTASVSTSTPPPTAPPPTDPPTTDPPQTAPQPATNLPCSAGSFFKDDVRNNTVDATLTSRFRTFMATHADQSSVTWPRLNLNPDWAMSTWTGSTSDPVWKLTGGNTTDPRLSILRTQGFHMADSVAGTFPTGTQDRPGVIFDPVFGYVVQFADAEPNLSTRTINVSNAGIMRWSSNCLDYRNPASDSDQNITSRGRIVPAMVVRPADLQRAMTNGTGLGHVLHLYFVETDTAAGFVHPMVGPESGKAGFGAEGLRIRIDPAVNLAAKGLTPGCLAIARTLQENGGYLGDNSGSATLVKMSQAAAYPASAGLSTDCMRGKVSWQEFQVVTPGQQ